MKVKSFMAPTMQEALKMIREDLGPEASILSSESVSGGVEIVAALNYREEVARAEIQSSIENADRYEDDFDSHIVLSDAEVAKEKADRHRRLVAEKSRVKERLQQANSEPETHQSISVEKADEGIADLRAMREELNRLRDMVTSARPQASLSLVQAKVAERLAACHIEHELREQIIASLAQETDLSSAWRSVQQQMMGQITIQGQPIAEQKEILALVGPSGCGKTSTAGKIAAQVVEKYGAGSVALITTDQYRVAAAEQLKVYGRILQIPVHSIRHVEALDEQLAQLRNKRLVIIDTPGLVPSDPDWNRHLSLLAESRFQIDVHVVVSANEQYGRMCHSIERHAGLNLTACIATKIDEAVSLGELMSMLVREDIPLKYVSQGTHIADDLSNANHLDLWSQMEKLAGLVEFRHVSVKKGSDIEIKSQYDMPLASRSA